VSYPDDNPKTAVGATKVPLHLVPPVATHYLALAFKDGAVKYGPYNWREHMVSASVYYGAMRRHMDAWWDGEDVSHDALVHHLGHVMACCAILLDAESVGKLNDDRPLPGAAGALQRGFSPTQAEPSALDRYLISGAVQEDANFVARVGQPETPTVEFEADPKLQALIERSDEEAPLEGLTAGKAHMAEFGPNPVDGEGAE